MKLVITLTKLFRCLCFITAVFMVGYWLYIFNQNEDVTLIEYKTFNASDETIYPEFTICIMNPFNSSKLKNEYGVTNESYLEYLNGTIAIDDSFLSIIYDSVTIDFYKYLNVFTIGMQSGPCYSRESEAIKED